MTASSHPPSAPSVPLAETAHVIRSKNAGPFELTLDILFRNATWFRQARNPGILSRRRIATLYRIPVRDVLGILYFHPVHAVKITLRRRVPSGNPGDSDIYGAQQHAPLLGLRIPCPEPEK